MTEFVRVDYGEYGVNFEHSFMDPVAQLTLTVGFDAESPNLAILRNEAEKICECSDEYRNTLRGFLSAESQQWRRKSITQRIPSFHIRAQQLDEIRHCSLEVRIARESWRERIMQWFFSRPASAKCLYHYVNLYPVYCSAYDPYGPEDVSHRSWYCVYTYGAFYDLTPYCW